MRAHSKINLLRAFLFYTRPQVSAVECGIRFVKKINYIFAVADCKENMLPVWILCRSARKTSSCLKKRV